MFGPQGPVLYLTNTFATLALYATLRELEMAVGAKNAWLPPPEIMQT